MHKEIPQNPASIAKGTLAHCLTTIPHGSLRFSRPYYRPDAKKSRTKASWDTDIWVIANSAARTPSILRQTTAAPIITTTGPVHKRLQLGTDYQPTTHVLMPTPRNDCLHNN